ncbi:hypothetical protein [Empedobacter sp. UBA7248]|uniref:hypothetical protein n=1 Tax=Empedobacter sp. UBA7248 TaxID=1946448 RepID=UPI0025BC942F|nr:hypothetical protein [Empedobacter sp. UBA7248]
MLGAIMENNQITNFQEQKIKKIISEMGSIFYDIQFRNEFYDRSENDYEDILYQLENNFIDLANRAYKLSSAYLESKNLPSFLSDFKNEINKYFASRNDTLSSKYHDESGDSYSEFISSLWSYLSVFPAFNDNDESLLKRSGLIYLENILESSSVILEERKIKPKNEAEISRNVKFVTKSVFPNSQYPSQPFLKTAKCYIPDILIPSLNCAIEYKLALNESKLTDTIDEILIDVKGYENNPDYKIFYAVFCVKSGICTRKRFYEIWEEKGFPQNWKGIYVESNI